MTDPFLPLVLAPDDVPAPPWPGPPPVVAVYGDSFTTGYGWGGIGPANWTVRVRDRLRLAVGNDAVGGTGFVQVTSGSTMPYAAAVWPLPQAQVAVVFGGRNDYQQTPDAVGCGAVVLLELLARANPSTRVVLVAPQWPAAAIPPTVLAIRDRLAAAASARPGVTYVDPSGWFQGRPDLIGPDGLHPTDAGHALIADRMAPIIAAALAQYPVGA